MGMFSPHMYSNRFEIEYGDTGGGPLSRDISVLKIEALLAYICANDKVVSFC